MRLGRALLLWGAALALLPLLLTACGGGDRLLLGATTSLQDTGILDELVRGFEKESGRDVTYVVAGSDQVLELARRGEVDVLITHSPDAEQQLVAAGEVIDRRPVMENQFLVAGPPDDRSGVKGAQTAAQAFQRIANSRHAFVSRGDGSGTNKRELVIWQKAGIDPQGQPWYQESATGQGQNLLIASDKGAYTLVDSATFQVFRDRVQLIDYVVDQEAPNLYSVMRVNPDKHTGVHDEAARAFADFVTSPQGQQLIQQFGRDKYGESIFLPASVGVSAGSPTPNR